MPLVLSQKLYQPTYDDIVGEQYHYPKRYWSYITTGEPFVYYHSWEPEDHRQYYFGAGLLGSIRADSKTTDHRYVEILEYTPFTTSVPFKLDNEYIEARPNVGSRFFSAVRRISPEVMERILKLANLEPEATSPLISPVIGETDEVLASFNKRYSDLTPRSYKRLVSEIDRPTVVSRALKEKFGYRCQICGTEGFTTKSGGRYAEAHHLLWLHKLLPNSLVTENILIVCANCHRQLHYADVEIEDISASSLRVIINGASYDVTRNIF